MNVILTWRECALGMYQEGDFGIEYKGDVLIRGFRTFDQAHCYLLSDEFERKLKALYPSQFATKCEVCKQRIEVCDCDLPF